MHARNTYDRSAILAGYTGVSSVGRAAPIKEDDDFDDDDGYQEEAEDDAQAEAPQEPVFDGPASWEEVDTEELERIAVNIMRSVVPSTENLEVGARLAMQAAAMEADNMDPLGLGRIDTRQLALVKSEHRSLNRMKTMAGRSGGATLAPVADSKLLRRGLAGRRASIDQPRGSGSGGDGGGGQSLEDMAGSRKQITTLEGIQRRGIQLDMVAREGGGGGDAAATGGGGRARGGRRAAQANLTHLRSRVIPTHEKFDPHVFLGTVHWETTLAELRTGRDNLQAELTERTGQLKALVKENFDHFISCKTTIDDIHKRLSEAERGHAGGAGSLVSTTDVIDTVRDVQQVAGHAFAELVERAAACDRIRGVLALLKRYDNLFRLPTRIRHASERGAYDQVIGEYRKARALMAGGAATAKGGVWQNLFHEVEKGVADMAGTLTAVLRSPRTTPAEAAEAFRHLLLLQAEGAPCLEHSDPIQLYLNTQERHVHVLLEAAGEEHMVRLRGVQQAARAAAAADERFKELQHLGEAGVLVSAKQPGSAANGVAAGRGGRGGAAEGSGGADATSVEGLWARYASRLTAIVVRHLRADYWHMPQDKEQALIAISDNAKRCVESSRANRSKIYNLLLREFSDKMTSALTQLAGEGRSKALFLAAVREAVAGCCKLAGRDAPPSVYVTLQHLLETVSGLAIGQLVAERATLVMRMAEVEDWDIVAATHKTGAPVSAVPGRLRAVVVAGMEQVQAVLAEAHRAQAVAPGHRFNTLATAAAALRGAFFESFTAYAVSTDRLSQDLMANLGSRGGAANGLAFPPVPSAPPGEAEDDAAAAAAAAEAVSNGVGLDALGDDGIGTDRKLLVLLSNCAFVRGSIMPTFAARFHGLLVADDGGQECRNLCAECGEDIKQVELRLASAYTEAKANALNDVLEEFFFDDGTLWEAAPLPAGVRDVTYEILATMAGVEAETYTASPGLLRRVLAELLQHTLATFCTILAEQLPETNLGGTLQLLVDLQYLAGAFSPLVSPAHEAVIGSARDLILTQALESVSSSGAGAGSAQQQLEQWLQGVEASGWKGPEAGGRLEDRIARACRAVAVAALKESRLNLSCFREAAKHAPLGQSGSQGSLRSKTSQSSAHSSSSLG